MASAFTAAIVAIEATTSSAPAETFAVAAEAAVAPLAATTVLEVAVTAVSAWMIETTPLMPS